MRSRENVGSGEMNGVVECKACGSKARPVSKAYDPQHSVKQPKWRALNVLLVLGDCTLIALQLNDAGRVIEDVLEVKVRSAITSGEVQHLIGPN